MDNNIIEETKIGDITIRIVLDNDPHETPREWDNLGKMLCFHRNYVLGDKTDITAEMFNSWGELDEYLIKEENAVIILPLYMYDHSGITISTRSFYGRLPQGHAEFDSGRIGVIYATKGDILKNFEGIKKITKKIKEKVENILQSEVDVYDLCVRGEVYGYQVARSTKCETCGHISEEIIDSCWGYYGLDSVKEAVEEAKKIDYSQEEGS